MQTDCSESVVTFFHTACQELGALAQATSVDSLEATARMILQACDEGSRLHVTGIGKPSHVARYTAALFSSVGTPSYFLDCTEAVHGSCGQLRPGDLVICISNSGETEELKSTVSAIRQNHCRVIAVTGRPGSWLEDHAERCLRAGVSAEGGPLNRAPRASVLAELLVLQGLSVALQCLRGLSVREYVQWHPHGRLGQVQREDPL